MMYEDPLVQDIELIEERTRELEAELKKVKMEIAVLKESLRAPLQVNWPAVREIIGQLYGQAARIRTIDGALMGDIRSLNSRIRAWQVEDLEEARLRARLVLRRRQEEPTLAHLIDEACKLLGLPVS